MTPETTPDLYRVLRCRRTATPATIEKAYRRRAKETHPDRGGDVEAFRLVDFAYSILSDPVARKRYDETGEAVLKQPDQSETMAVRVLSTTLAKVVMGMIEHGQRPESRDVLLLMRQSLAASKNETAATQAKLRKIKATVLETIDRFSVSDGGDGGANMLADVTQTHLAEIDAQLVALDAEAKAIGSALEILKKYRYRFEAAPMFRAEFFDYRPVAKTTILVPSP